MLQKKWELTEEDTLFFFSMGETAACLYIDGKNPVKRKIDGLEREIRVAGAMSLRRQDGAGSRAQLNGPT